MARESNYHFMYSIVLLLLLLLLLFNEKLSHFFD